MNMAPPPAGDRHVVHGTPILTYVLRELQVCCSTLVARPPSDAALKYRSKGDQYERCICAWLGVERSVVEMLPHLGNERTACESN
ncbi:unnamed protein product [Ectocarpus sp. CCAP 1310/34]|nr:unnamed protein product [Ectocarpus sp. CCAP 1310/34]